MRSDEFDEHELFGLDVDRTRYLYHFTSLANAASIALTGHLSGGTLWTQNDPREANAIPATYRWPVEVADDARVDGMMEERRVAFEEFRSRVRILSFAQDELPPTSDGSVREYFPEKRNRRAFASGSMWHHYGDAHRRACLVFDKSELLRSSPLGWTGDDIKYIDGPEVNGAESCCRQARTLTFLAS